jgi:hypothetical protein
LPKEEQQRLRDRWERLMKLPPEQRRAVLEEIPKLQNLPPDRRRAIGRELMQLRNLPVAERQARINSEEFRSRYSLSEQRMMSDLSQILPAPK